MSIVTEDIENILDEHLPWSKLHGKTVLVTGATGMVGQYLVRVLLGLSEKSTSGPTVIALARNREKAERLFADCLPMDKLKLLVQDVSTPLAPAQHVDYIFHAASPANPSAFRDDPVGVILANVQGTTHCLELARSNKAVCCFISTLEVYGQLSGNCLSPLKEDAFGAIDSLDLRSAYPESKRLAENLCVAYSAQYGIEYRIIRLSHTYGPGMSLDDPRVQTSFMKKAIHKEDIVLKSNGSLKRTYTYIADAISAIFFIALAGGQGAYNVASESAKVSVKELAEIVIKNAPDPSKRIIFDIADTEKEMWSKINTAIYLDCSRLHKLGWQAHTSVEVGVKRTMSYHMSQS